MSRRRTNPDTGEPELTYREQIFINEYITNGGNGKDAAIAAGYGRARADQSAYQVLHRFEVQQHIQDRISESTVSADEIIGTLVSFMRGNIAQVLDDDGNFDIRLVKQRRLGHLLKTVTRTTRKIKAEPGQPPHLAQDYRIQLHSPVQAASILARLKGLNRRSPDFESDDTAARQTQPDSLDADYFTNSDDPHSLSVDYFTKKVDSDSNSLPVDLHCSAQHDLVGLVPDEYIAPPHDDPPGLTGEPRWPRLEPSTFNFQPSTCKLSNSLSSPSSRAGVLPPAIKDMLDPSAWMEALIKLEMQRDGRSRSAVIQALLQLRPEAAEFIRPEPDSQDASLAAPSEIEPNSNSAAAPIRQPIASASPCGQVGTLPHTAAFVLVDDANAPALPTQDSGLELAISSSTATPALQDADLTAAASQPSANGPQPISSEQLKRITRVIKNLRKINPTQCLNQHSTRPAQQSPQLRSVPFSDADQLFRSGPDIAGETSSDRSRSPSMPP